ncbi:MAG: hypothetical protein WD227_11115 [Vicinamibacterales bacterium]
MAAVVAVVFGLATVVAGGRVLAGADPGYGVFRPLLIYNTAMGAAYVAAGLAMWRSLPLGRKAAALIFVVNVVVLCAITLGHSRGWGVAVESVAAMGFRTLVWLVLLLLLVWLGARSRAERLSP